MGCSSSKKVVTPTNSFLDINFKVKLYFANLVQRKIMTSTDTNMQLPAFQMK